LFAIFEQFQNPIDLPIIGSTSKR